MFNFIKIVLYRSYVLADMEVKKLIHDPTELITWAIQPILWLGIFGEVLSKDRAIPTEGYSYLQFITPGILIQLVIFTAIFYGLSIIFGT
jgi:ABC-2 type transport system permease protein